MKPTVQQGNENLILDDGWHNLRNDLSRTVGYEFELRENRSVTHLGMWDDRQRDADPAARGIPAENGTNRAEGQSPRNQRPHLLILRKLGKGLSVELSGGNENRASGELDGEFRSSHRRTVALEKGGRYMLTMTRKRVTATTSTTPFPTTLPPPPPRRPSDEKRLSGTKPESPLIPAFEDLHPTLRLPPPSRPHPRFQ